MPPLVWILFGGIVAAVLVQRIVELRIAARNQRWALSQGAQEFGAGHYPLFFVLHGGWAIAWLTEAIWLGPILSPIWPLWLALFGIAQILRYWALASLGTYWNTRILIIPGHKRVKAGIYRYLPHPNYLAVALELASIPLLFGAWRSALVASLLNAALLLLIRIPAENNVLRQLQ
jgi:methyltransferase